MAVIRRNISKPDVDGEDAEKIPVADKTIKALPIDRAKDGTGYDIRECLRALGLNWQD